MPRLELHAYMRVDTRASTRNALTTVALLGLLPGFGGLIAATAGKEPLGALLALPSVAALVARLVLRTREVAGLGSLRVEKTQMVFRGHRREASIPLVDIVSGAHSPEERGVRFDLRDGRSVLVCPALDADVRPLLHATGTTVRRRVAVFPLQGEVQPVLAGIGYFVGSVVFFAALIHFANRAGARLEAGAPLVVTVLGLGLVVTVALLTLLRPRLVVGLDGLQIHFGLRRRFVPHGDILRVDVQPDATAGSVLRIQTGRDLLQLPLHRTPPEVIARMVLRIQQGIDAALPDASPSFVPAGTFARGRQSFTAWRDALRGAFARTDYRRAAIPTSAAEALVADASAPLDDRVGAAFALQLGGAKRATRLARRAATSSADDAAKRAFEAVVSGDEAALDAAMRVIEQRSGASASS